MALEQLDKDWILEKIRESTEFSSKAVGDTPTDANQLVNKRYVNSYAVYGEVDNGGTAIYLPTGWSSTRNGAGLYTVTHNLGTTNYGVVASSFATGFDRDFTVNISNRSANSFQVETILTAFDTDCPFFFVLIKQP